MARYIAKQRGQIPADGTKPVKRADSSSGRPVMRIVEAGEEFEFHGKPGKWMEPVKGASQTDQGAQGNESNARRGRKTASNQTDQGGSQAQTSQDDKDAGGPPAQ